jgi:putative mRNA 3-end processing factor
LLHESIVDLTQCYREAGRILAKTEELKSSIQQRELEGDLILAPPSILKDNWIGKLGRYETAFASGWMQGSSFAHGKSYDYGFVLSDHADWTDLNRTIFETGAKQVFVLHRSNGALIRHLNKKVIKAYPISDLKSENYHRNVELNLSLF